MTKSGQPPPHNWKKMRQHMWFCRSHVSSITHFFNNYFIACVFNGWAMKIGKKQTKFGVTEAGVDFQKASKITPRLQRGHIPFQTHNKLTDWLIWEELVEARKTKKKQDGGDTCYECAIFGWRMEIGGMPGTFLFNFCWEEGSREASNWTTVMILSNFRCAYIYCSPIQGE